MLTQDEVTLAGGIPYSSSSYYLENSAVRFWSISPYWYYINHGANFTTHDSPVNNNVDDNAGIRPVISLKSGASVIRGTGNPGDPYVIN